MLQFLDATENCVEWVADEIGDCDCLTDLHLNTNNIMQLPEKICMYKLFPSETLLIS